MLLIMTMESQIKSEKMKTLIRLLCISLVLMALSGCSVSAVKNDLTQILTNLSAHVEPIREMLKALCFVLGIVFIGGGVFKLKQYGQQTVMSSTHAAMGPALASIFVGAGLLFMPTFLDVMTVSIWGYGHDQVIYGYADQGSDFSDIMDAIIKIIQLVGFVALMRGWIMFLKLGSQGSPPGTLGKGFAHLIGGILAININGTIDILRATFGFV